LGFGVGVAVGAGVAGAGEAVPSGSGVVAGVGLGSAVMSPATIPLLGEGDIEPAPAIWPVTENSDATISSVSTATTSRRLVSPGRNRRPI
jgi:hypothetical protein